MSVTNHESFSCGAMDKIELLAKLARLRVRTRNVDVVDLIDVLSAMLGKKSPKVGRPCIGAKPKPGSENAQ